MKGFEKNKKTIKKKNGDISQKLEYFYGKIKISPDTSWQNLTWTLKELKNEVIWKRLIYTWSGRVK